MLLFTWTADRAGVYISAILSSVILLLYACKNRLRRISPRYLHSFAAETGTLRETHRTWNHWTLLLGVLCVAGTVLATVSAITCKPRQPITVGIAKLVPWISASWMTIYSRPTYLNHLLFCQHVVILLAGLLIYSFHFLHHTLQPIDHNELVRLCLSLAASTALIHMPLRNPALDAHDIAYPKSAPSHQVRSPEDRLTLWRFWTMSWVQPLIQVCRCRDISFEDVWSLPFENQHHRLNEAFRELRGGLISRLIEANGADLVISSVLAVSEKVLEVSTIRLSSRFYDALDASQPDEAYFWCLVLFCLDFIRQLFKTTSSWYARKAYERSRGETFIGLFCKLLTRVVPASNDARYEVTEGDQTSSPSRSQKSRNTFQRCCQSRKSRQAQKTKSVRNIPASNAKIINLMRGDTYEISQRFWDFPKLVSQPIKVLATAYYLIATLGIWSSIPGFLLLVLLLTANSLLVHQVVKLERVRARQSDLRAQAVSHFVEASQPLKLNGWNDSWLARIMELREEEMATRMKIAQINAAMTTINTAGGAVLTFASLFVFTFMLRQSLTSGIIWPSLQLFSQLQLTTKEAFDLFSAYWKAKVPFDRVNEYMAEQDRVESEDKYAPESVDSGSIRFHKAVISWPSTVRPILGHLNLDFNVGLTIIRGAVGAGKSALLLAALNEMELSDGEIIRHDGSIAFAQQAHWLQRMTIRDNIVFHEVFDLKRYQAVIHACALGPDLAALEFGDQTALEEGGVGLSGGQKARVCLARAIYSRSKRLILDDPFASLDSDTAAQIVQRLFQGPLVQGRIVIVATHMDHLLLHIADQVVEVQEGTARTLSKDCIQYESKNSFPDADRPSFEEDMHAGMEPEGATDETRPIPEESSKSGVIPMSLLTNYMRAGGGRLWLFLALFYGLSRYFEISRAKLLEVWSNATYAPSSASFRTQWLPEPSDQPQKWLLVLAALGFGEIVSFGIAQILLASISIGAARRIFRDAILKLNKATCQYYETTPTGQLKNRLISDMGMIDGGIIAPLEGFVYSLITLALGVTAITVHQPPLLLILIAVASAFVFIFRQYVPVSRCLRRMEMRYLTPIIANIGVMQNGLVTIRAFQVERFFQDRHLDAVDDFQKFDHFFWSMAFWLDFRLNMTTAFARAILVVSMLLLGTSASAVGFVLTQATVVMAAVAQLCENFAKLQLDAVSLERVDTLNHIPEESDEGCEPPPFWPRATDDVSFESMAFRYDDNMMDVLKNVTFRIPGGSTAAILGRTGSGKSTIANALLATREAYSGRIRIGDIDIAKVSKTVLRQRITFIQQEPIVFPGNLRDNLDPAGKFLEQRCNEVVQRVLGPHWDLYSCVDSLSQGQRQLLGIARAILRRSGLIILDEATASIDRDTAASVYKILRTELKGSTVIIIAHRAEAVKHANWLLRLESGTVVECGPTTNNADAP